VLAVAAINSMAGMPAPLVNEFQQWWCPDKLKRQGQMEQVVIDVKTAQQNVSNLL
jgi:hypothetical protein